MTIYIYYIYTIYIHYIYNIIYIYIKVYRWGANVGPKSTESHAGLQSANIQNMISAVFASPRRCQNHLENYVSKCLKDIPSSLDCFKP